MNSEPMQLLGPGGTFKENPGCKHRLSENASTTEDAVIFATFIVDTEHVESVGPEGLLVIDEEWREVAEEKMRKMKEDAALIN